MRRIAKIAREDRAALFQNAAAKMGVHQAIVEKDFWVCYVLDYLFHRDALKDHYAFKGGTSLSKAFSLIERFSEDIDLILDWRILGYRKDEPWEERTPTQQQRFNEEANFRVGEFLRDFLVPRLILEFRENVNGTMGCWVDKNDPQTIRIAYPSNFSDPSLLQEIRLEVGALGAWSPCEWRRILPYSAEHYGHLFLQPSTDVLAVLPERTFWEKATILHREAFRPAEKPLPPRYSRHYYDLFRMAGTSVKTRALESVGLMKTVVAFKEKFYRCPWARYDLAKPETIRLLPSESRIPELEKDYRAMRNMLFGDVPEFEKILEALSVLEKEIHGFMSRNGDTP